MKTIVETMEIDTSPPKPRWRSLPEQAERLDISETILRKAIKTKELRAYAFGGAAGYRITDADADAWVEGKANR